MKITRRGFEKALVATLPIARSMAGINSAVNGVQLGICSFSFRNLGLDELIRQMAAVPMSQLELESVFVEPASTQPPPPAPRPPAAPGAAPAANPAGPGRGQSPEQREALRKWRLTVPLDDIRA